MNIIKVLLYIGVISVSIIIISLVGIAISQKIKEYWKFRSYKKKSLEQQKKTERKRIEEKQAAPLHLKTLLHQRNVALFKNFVKLLDEINWPEEPEEILNEEGEKVYPSIIEKEDYEDNLDDALDEEDRMYNLYLSHLQSKNIEISKAELYHVIELYRDKSE